MIGPTTPHPNPFALCEHFPRCRILHAMKPATDPSEKTQKPDGPAEPGYAAWKRAKVERGLAEAENRDAMIPIRQPLQ